MILPVNGEAPKLIELTLNSVIIGNGKTSLTFSEVFISWQPNNIKD
jgi:hypothetical protein